jgi:hypothetical protein
MALTGVIEERFIHGQYGEIYHEGHYQGDLASFTGRITIEQIPIKRAGTNQTVYRRGDINKGGTIVLNKVDSRFEKKLIDYANLSTDERRALRDAGIDPWPATDFIIKINDPDSWGGESLHIMGVRIWEMALGFEPGSFISRDLPITWDQQKLLEGVPRPGNKQGYTAHTGAVAAGSDGDLVY